MLESLKLCCLEQNHVVSNPFEAALYMRLSRNTFAVPCKNQLNESFSRSGLTQI